MHILLELVSCAHCGGMKGRCLPPMVVVVVAGGEGIGPICGADGLMKVACAAGEGSGVIIWIMIRVEVGVSTGLLVMDVGVLT